MLRVRTLLLPSAIHGTGVFAVDAIPQGAIVWQFDPQQDLVLPRRIALSSDVATYFRHFSYYDAGRNGYVLCGDNAKWMNHSDMPNTLAVFDRNNEPVYARDVAACDICAGEELTCDYRVFDKSLTA